MYERHVKNYENWKDKLSMIIKKHSVEWLDMQDEKTYKSIGFGPFAFENTYAANQHLTYSGSLLATYSLASFLRDSLQLTFPEKSQRWHKLFYGVEGYFENYSPSVNDKQNKILCQNKKIRNGVLDEVLLIDNKKQKLKRIIAKIDRQTFDNKKIENLKLSLLVKYKLNNKDEIGVIELNYDIFHTPKDEAIFTQNIKPLAITEILDGNIDLR
jgi:hypothetical protein